MLLWEPPVNSVAYHESIEIAFLCYKLRPQLAQRALLSLSDCGKFNSICIPLCSLSISIYIRWLAEQLQWVVVGETCWPLWTCRDLIYILRFTWIFMRIYLFNKTIKKLQSIICWWRKPKDLSETEHHIHIRPTWVTKIVA